MKHQVVLEVTTYTKDGSKMDIEESDMGQDAYYLTYRRVQGRFYQSDIHQPTHALHARTRASCCVTTPPVKGQAKSPSDDLEI